MVYHLAGGGKLTVLAKAVVVLRILLMPKSASFSKPLEDRKMFCGFTSLPSRVLVSVCCSDGKAELGDHNIPVHYLVAVNVSKAQAQLGEPVQDHILRKKLPLLLAYDGAEVSCHGSQTQPACLLNVPWHKESFTHPQSRTQG